MRFLTFVDSVSHTVHLECIPTYYNTWSTAYTPSVSTVGKERF